MKGENTMIKFATIGTNFVVNWFLNSAAKCRDLEYVATYSRDIEKAKEFGGKYNSRLFFDDLEEMAKCQDIDAVYIASPNSFHYEQAMLMMKHKKHILVEKTIASNSKEVKELIQTAKQNNVVMMEAMRSIFDPGFLAIEKAIEEIKPVRRASFHFGKYSSRYDKFKNGIVENAFNPKFSNGSLMDMGVYCVHPMIRLFGKPEEIMSQAIILPDSIDGEGTIIAKYHGMLAEMTYSKISDNMMQNQIEGEKGTILIDDISQPREIVTYFRDGRVEKADITLEDTENNLVYEAFEWVNMIKESDYSDKHNKYSLMTVEVMDEARKQQGIIYPADCE